MQPRFDWKLSFVFTATALCALFFTVTNFVVLSAITVCLAVSIPFLLSARNQLSFLSSALISLYIYFFLHITFYHPASLMEYDFYRRDGNVFVTFFPLLIYPLIAIRLRVKRVLFFFLIWVTVINLIFITVFLLTKGYARGDGTFHFLFYAHNAAGGFLAMLTAFAIGYYLHNKSKLTLSCVIINGFGLYITNSRGSIIGFIIAVMMVIVLKRRFTKCILLLAVGSLILLLSYSYPLWTSLGYPLSYMDIESMDSAFLTRSFTIIDRAVFLWPRAVYLWLYSPIIGTGFGSYDDIPYHLSGIPHLVGFNIPLNVNYSSAHAHHTFLHVLAETGILGLGLVVTLLYSIKRRIVIVKDPALQSALLLAFWTVIWSSFTEHRLFTPAQMLPFTLLLGLTIAHENGLKLHLYEASKT